MLIIRLVFEAIMMVFKTSQETAVFVQVYRSSRPELFCKYGVPRNFVKLTGKHLCQSLFFNKVAVASETKTFFRMHAFFIAIFQ